MDMVRNMRIFLQVVNSGGFSLVARALGHKSPADVSRAVSMLESHLQARLLHRTTRSVAVTAAGERFLGWSICSEQSSVGVGRFFVSMKELSFRQPGSR
jgi:DNA-binding transcriptional LysR family regulator